MVMPVVGFYKVDELPAEAEPNAFYYIRRTGYAEAWLTTSAGDPVPIGSIAVAQWGEIKGDIELQADLVALLADKQDSASLGSAAFADASSFATAAQGLLAENAQPKEAGKGLSEQNYTLAEKDKLAWIEAEATKNRSDADTDLLLAGKVSNDDVRLSNAREWSADTVTQAEAETGDATTRRAWTAQRVRQAFVSYFGAISSTLGRTLIGRATAALMRADLGLGTAATRNVGTAAGDVMEVGAGGWLSALADNTADVNNPPQITTTYRWSTNAINAPFESPAGAVIRIQRSKAHSDGFEIGYIFDSNKFIARAQQQIGTLLPWVMLTHSGNLLATTGQSTQFPMTQKATTDAINGMSDLRDKTDISDLSVGLSLVSKLKPTTFKLNPRDKYRRKEATKTDEEGNTSYDADILAKPLSDYDENDGSEAGNHVHTGFIAQEVKQTLDELGLSAFGLVKNFSEEYNGGDDRYYIEHNGLIAILVKSVQELSAEIDELKKTKADK